MSHSLISRYRVIRPLGAGGVGQVYLADDLQLQRQAAERLTRAEQQSLGTTLDGLLDDLLRSHREGNPEKAAALLDQTVQQAKAEGYLQRPSAGAIVRLSGMAGVCGLKPVTE